MTIFMNNRAFSLFENIFAEQTLKNEITRTKMSEKY